MVEVHIRKSVDRLDKRVGPKKQEQFQGYIRRIFRTAGVCAGQKQENRRPWTGKRIFSSVIGAFNEENGNETIMNKILVSLITLPLVFACASSRAGYLPEAAVRGKNAYYIELLIEGEKNRDVQLCKYLSTGIYPADSAVTDKKGKAIFAGSRPLVPGMYAVVTREKSVFDFFISDTVNQKFNISAVKNKYLETLSFENSPENEAFADYSRSVLERRKKENKLYDKNLFFLPNAEIEALTEQTDAKETEIKTKFPGSLLESVAMAMNPRYPNRDEIQGNSGVVGQPYLRDFRRKHYWDKITLTDNRLLNTPVLASSVDEYFDNFVAQIPDSIIIAIDHLLPKVESDTAMMNFLTGYIFDKYFHHDDDSGDSGLMWSENVVVHLIDSYYLAGRTGVNDGSFIKDITEYADKNRGTLIGKQARELKMETISGGAESLYDIDAAYTLICFFDAACSHCKHEIPQIYKVFRKYEDRGLSGFCVYTRDDKKEWIEFVAQYDLTGWINAWDPKNENDFRTAYSLYIVPQVYLLDRNKKIIGRKLNGRSLARLLNDLIQK
jgi:peroxiredoxin